MSTKLRTTVLAAIAAASLAWADPAGVLACDVSIGQRVMLASLSTDPDVFVWDSRARLIDYAAGLVDDAKTVIAHTTLAKPGTRAIVTMCAAGAVKPKYVVAPYDAVGIKLTSGPNRGRYGWVAGEDVHVK